MRQIARFLAGVGMLLCAARVVDLAGAAGHSFWFSIALVGMLLCAWTMGALDA